MPNQIIKLSPGMSLLVVNNKKHGLHLVVSTKHSRKPIDGHDNISDTDNMDAAEDSEQSEEVA